MSLDLKILALSILPGAAPADAAAPLYSPPVNRAAIISGMRFTNTSANDATLLQAFFIEAGGTMAEKGRRILPVDLLIPPGRTFVDNDQITLGPGDRIVVWASTPDVVHACINGSERPL